MSVKYKLAIAIGLQLFAAGASLASGIEPFHVALVFAGTVIGAVSMAFFD